MNNLWGFHVIWLIYVYHRAVSKGSDNQELEQFPFEKSTLPNWRSFITAPFTEDEVKNNILPFFHLDKLSGPVYKLRTGNNWVQLLHAFNYAICCRGVLVISVSFDVFPNISRYYNFSEFNGGINCNKTINITGSFFLMSKIPLSLPKCKYDEFAVMQLYLFNNSEPYGVESNGLKCQETYGNLTSSLVVHIRSGDIIGRNIPGIHYIQPPISFYLQILNSFKWERVIFVTSPELNLNPVWYYLKNYTSSSSLSSSSPSSLSIIPKYHSNTTYSFQMSQDFLYDFNLFLCARNFVAAHSSLSSMITEVTTVMEKYFHYQATKQRYPMNCRLKRMECYRYKCHQNITNWEEGLVDENVKCALID